MEVNKFHEAIRLLNENKLSVVSKDRQIKNALLIEAQAQAEANTILARSLTNTLVNYEIATRWDGKVSQVSGSAGVLLNMPNK